MQTVFPAHWRRTWRVWMMGAFREVEERAVGLRSDSGKSGLDGEA